MISIQSSVEHVSRFSNTKPVDLSMVNYRVLNGYIK